MHVHSQYEGAGATLTGSDYSGAYQALRQLWSSRKNSATAAQVLSQKEQLAPYLELRRQRLAILRSFTVEPIVPILSADGFVNGVDVSVHVGEFNSYATEILAETSSLYSFDPDLIILAVQTRDIAPELWNWRNAEEGRKAVDRVLDEYRNLLTALRVRHRANVVVHDFDHPLWPRQGLLDFQTNDGQRASISALNAGLRKLASGIPGVFVFPYEELVSAHGRERWYDERKWLTARFPLAAESLVPIGLEWARILPCLAGRISKVIVTDLDNTLWGGIVGEDGAANLRMGTEYPGAGFRELQDALLACHERGIILAVASKNNEQDAMSVLESHPDMLLRPKHFSSLKIGWNSKAQSIREIAHELNVGIDSIAFLDDNPAERELVRQELPAVTIIDLPKEPMQYAAAIRRHGGLERLRISHEDRERNRHYAAQKQRQELASSAATLEDFYRSLSQELEIQAVQSNTVTRIAQLTQKTNQFNLTTKRYTEQDISRLAAIAGWSVLGATVRDRFGDNGLVGVVITYRDGSCLEIDTLLLSCRVIGKTIETALLAYVVEQARAAGCGLVRGWFQPTKKNPPAADFFRRHGFTHAGTTDGREEWVLNLESSAIKCPAWIQITRKDHELSEYRVA